MDVYKKTIEETKDKEQLAFYLERMKLIEEHLNAKSSIPDSSPELDKICPPEICLAWFKLTNMLPIQSVINNNISIIDLIQGIQYSVFRSKGVPFRDIASIFGVSHTHVMNILKQTGDLIIMIDILREEARDNLKPENQYKKNAELPKEWGNVNGNAQVYY